jgi:hypothetical protein
MGIATMSGPKRKLLSAEDVSILALLAQYPDASVLSKRTAVKALKDRDATRIASHLQSKSKSKSRTALAAKSLQEWADDNKKST